MIAHCAVVDAYSTGRYLAPALARRGLQVVHVQSTPTPPEFFRASFRANDFIDNVVYEGSLTATLGRLSRYPLRFVIAGSEYGVRLADLLSESLGLPTNGSAGSAARRNKHLMAEALRRAGLRAADSVTSRTSGQILKWARQQGRWPLVLKPVDSAGGDGVFFCHDVEDVVRAFSRISSRHNAMGRWNDEVMAQAYLDGVEYFVNSVSVHGQHRLAEIWRYHKRRLSNERVVYDREEPLRWQGAVQAELRRYVPQVLDALGVRHGPAHTEVMMTAEGPVLVETGARLAGSILPGAVSRCFGTNHVELTVDAYVDTARFLRHRDEPYQLQTNLRYVSLISSRAGVVRSLEGFRAVRSLPSFCDMHLQLTPGGRVARTVDSRTSPGYVYLLHAEVSQLERDYECLRSLEQTNLYELEQWGGGRGEG